MAGISLEREIFEISEKPDKCIGYPIGSQLDTFVRSQANEPNFILCASIVSAAATIYGRNVDYLLQEAYGIVENLSKDQEADKENTKIQKKSRVKKFSIKDKVNIFQISFEEKNINIQEKRDINKTLSMPSELSKMRKLKDFFAKNKQNNGKLAMPKSCQLLNDTGAVSSTFGSNLIYDYDESDVVGSRKDFASHCHIIDPFTGELLRDLCFNSDSIQNVQGNETHHMNQQAEFIPNCEALFSPIISSNEDDGTLQFNESNDCSLSVNISDIPDHSDNTDHSLIDQQSATRLLSPLSISLDEGIDVSDPQDLLLASPKLSIKILKISTSQEMIDNYLNIKKIMENSNSLLTRSFYQTYERILKSHSDFVLPLHIQSTVADSRLRNILMIPLQKLKHKCAFDLPAEEFMQYKKMKMSQHKSTVEEVRTKRMFKIIDCSKASEVIRECSVALDSPPCFGFSSDELTESPQTVHVITPLELLIKSNDDVLRARSRTSSETMCPHRISSDSFDSGIGSTTIGNDSINLTNTVTDFEDDLNQTKKTDSCYQSMASGMSGASREVEEFMNSGAERTRFEYEDEPSEPSENIDNLTPQKPATQIIEMQKLANNVARWREYLKPVLDQAENRNHFDIHHYGSMIIKKVETIAQTSREVSFKDIVEVGETPRYFLSMLQLINSGNLEIKKDSTGFLEPVLASDIKIKILSHVRHNEMVENIGAYLPGTMNKPLLSVSHKRKLPIDVRTSTPASKKQTMQPSCSSTPSQNNSTSVNVADDLFTSMTNSTFSQESGYSSFATQNSQSMEDSI
ncbi:unnamed protein product [Diamesa serratosioi]